MNNEDKFVIAFFFTWIIGTMGSLFALCDCAENSVVLSWLFVLTIIPVIPLLLVTSCLVIKVCLEKKHLTCKTLIKTVVNRKS